MDLSQSPSPAELNVKLDQIRGLLAERELDGLLLRRTENLAWATCGADAYINIADSIAAASLLITQSERMVLTNNIEAARLMEEEGLSQLGWKFEVSSWINGDGRLQELTRGMRLGSDSNHLQAADLSGEIASLRSRLTPEEGGRFRLLAKLCAEGMQDAMDSVQPGMSEFEIAGVLSESVRSRGVQPVVNLVAVDERIYSYRHPLPTDKKLSKYAMLILCGRKWGLICSLTRLVHFGFLPDEIRKKAEAVARIDAEMIGATRPGRTLGDVFGQAQAAYVAIGYPDEWKRHHQGGSAGYAPREVTATPSSSEPIFLGQAFAWNPSIAGAKSEDTILVGERSNEIITEMPGWPCVEVELENLVVSRPTILERK